MRSIANKAASALVASLIVGMIENVSTVLSVSTIKMLPTAFSLMVIAVVDVKIGAFIFETVTMINLSENNTPSEILTITS